MRWRGDNSPSTAASQSSPFGGGELNEAMTLRIRDGHYYVLGFHPGISGFKQWDKVEEHIVSAAKARNNRAYLLREYLARGLGSFRCDDGHLPDYQPIASEVEALRFLDANPFSSIQAVKPHTKTGS